jgi:hypothetical protein
MVFNLSCFPSDALDPLLWKVNRVNITRIYSPQRLASPMLRARGIKVNTGHSKVIWILFHRIRTQHDLLIRQVFGTKVSLHENVFFGSTRAYYHALSSRLNMRLRTEVSGAYELLFLLTRSIASEEYFHLGVTMTLRNGTKHNLDLKLFSNYTSCHRRLDSMGVPLCHSGISLETLAPFHINCSSPKPSLRRQL